MELIDFKKRKPRTMVVMEGLNSFNFIVEFVVSVQCPLLRLD